MNVCNIIRLFDRDGERTIENLSKYYTDIPFLKKKIVTAINGSIDNNTTIKGKSILLKPNWVKHNQKKEDDICLRTHEAIILALLEILLEHKPKKIIIGDAPIQGCDWEKMLSADFKKEVRELSKFNNIPIQIKDFRRVTFNSSQNKVERERNPLSNYLIFDLGEKSFLEPISAEKNNFRVTDYDPDRLGRSHKKGVHKYCITKDVFDADIVISIPKVKTHQKTGITCALKNLVGLNGDKDFLPHHRFGGTGFGGDCYPGKNIFRYAAEFLMDMANRRQGRWLYVPFMYSGVALWKISNPQKVHHLAAGWYGNDTTWRMVMDLNKIAIYGKADGTIDKVAQRQLYSLCDGIIAGQGNGPLNPEPLPLGIISFTNHSGLNDICMASLMGFDYKKIPLLFNPSNLNSLENIEIFNNGVITELHELKNYSIKTLPPPGWFTHLK